MSLKYYADEHARHPVLHAAPITADEIVVALKKLCRHFKIQPPRLELTSGSWKSHANRYVLRINRDRASWLLLIHELGHTWHDQRDGRANENWHGRTHRKLVNRLARYVLKQRWHAGPIAAQIAAREQKRAATEVLRRNPTRAMKIEKRRAQIAKLDKKIKLLTSRRRTAARSLAALERAERKAEQRVPVAANSPLA